MTAHRGLWRASRFLIVFIAGLAVVAEPALAQSVLRDTETERFLDDISAPMVRAAHLDPKNVKVVLVGDPEINAFVAGGQVVYINSGLIHAADNANEVEGVIAHELGHIEDGHAIRGGEGERPALAIEVLSLILGAAAMAAGAGDAGMAAIMAGQTAAMGKFLAFSRVQEASADAAAVRHLNDAHLSGKGMISFFGKLKQEEYRLSSSYAATDPFAQTHPMTADRQAVLQADLEKSPWWNAPQDPAKQVRFLRIKAKLEGYVADPEFTLREYPDSDQSIYAHYARAYAWHKSAYPDKAAAEVAALLRADPHDPYFLELAGQILLETGHPKEAVPLLRQAVARSNDAPMIASLMGQALIATEDPANYAEAEQVLKLSVSRDREDPLAWYGLGNVYALKGDQARASLAIAERWGLEGDDKLALVNAEQAMKGLPQGSPDYLRAEDIALSTRPTGKKGKK